jgi:hypothetical protein
MATAAGLSEHGADTDTPTTPAAVSAARRRLEVGSITEHGVVSEQLLSQVNRLVVTAAAETAAEESDAREARLEQLKRSWSSRRVQAAWRAFKARDRTTERLARAFADTGVIIVGPLSRSPSTAGIVNNNSTVTEGQQGVTERVR